MTKNAMQSKVMGKTKKMMMNMPMISQEKANNMNQVA
jgi:hypothetical protein